MLTNSLLQTGPLLSPKVSCDTPLSRADMQNCQLLGTATAWKKQRLSAPSAPRASQHLPQKVYSAVATVSLRNFVRALVASRADPEPEKARLDISQKTGGQQYTIRIRFPCPELVLSFPVLGASRETLVLLAFDGVVLRAQRGACTGGSASSAASSPA